MPSVLDKIKKQQVVNNKIRVLANSIRKKYLALKLGKTSIDEEIENFFKPVTDPLRKLVKNAEKSNPINQLAPADEEAAEEEQTMRYSTRFPGRRGKSEPVPKLEKASTPEKSRLDTSALYINPLDISAIEKPSSSAHKKSEDTYFYNAEENDNDDDEVFHANKTLHEVSQTTSHEANEEYLDQFPTIARGYIERYFDDPELFDTTYGVRNDPELEKWYIGSKIVTFDTFNEIVVDNKRYPGTGGLYELMFMKDPKDSLIKPQDLAFYKEILERSCAHRLNHDPASRIKGTAMSKYTTYIKPLINPARKPSSKSKKSGTGLRFNYKINNNKPIEYVYWDDINELVDRLRLIYASKMAGNTSHDNEIASIIEELKEAGVISGNL